MVVKVGNRRFIIRLKAYAVTGIFLNAAETKHRVRELEVIIIISIYLAVF
jgi:hypothetical protein